AVPSRTTPCTTTARSAEDGRGGVRGSGGLSRHRRRAGNRSDAGEADVGVLEAARFCVEVEAGRVDVHGEDEGRAATGDGRRLVDATLLQNGEVARVQDVFMDDVRSRRDDSALVAGHERARSVDLG